MYRKTTLAVLALVATTTGVFAGGVTPGAEMLARNNGVEPSVYSVSDLVRVDAARRESHSAAEVRFILNDASFQAATRADTVNDVAATASAQQLAASLNVEASDFTLDQLVALQAAARESERSQVRAILAESGSAATVDEVLN